jgi:hypothetical protein
MMQKSEPVSINAEIRTSQMKTSRVLLEKEEVVVAAHGKVGAANASFPELGKRRMPVDEID